jgi:hypothetical protein
VKLINALVAFHRFAAAFVAAIYLIEEISA